MSGPRQIDGSDLLLGILSLGGAAAYLYEASQIPESLLEDGVGARGLPTAIGWSMAVLGLVLCLRGARSSALLRARTDVHAPASSELGEASGAVRRHLVALGLLAILAFYVVALPYAGYVVSTALLVGGVARFAGAPFGRDLLLIGLTGSVVLWLLFDPVLGISLPVGAWWQGR